MNHLAHFFLGFSSRFFARLRQAKSLKEALMVADVSEVRRILEKGTDPNDVWLVKSEDGASFGGLHCALPWNYMPQSDTTQHAEIATMLIDFKARVDDVDRDGLSVVHWSAIYGYELVVQAVFAAVSQDPLGRPTIRELLDQKAGKKYDNKTAMELAIEFKQPDVEVYLNSMAWREDNYVHKDIVKRDFVPIEEYEAMLREKDRLILITQQLQERIRALQSDHKVSDPIC